MAARRDRRSALLRRQRADRLGGVVSLSGGGEPAAPAEVTAGPMAVGDLSARGCGPQRRRPSESCRPARAAADQPSMADVSSGRGAALPQLVAGPREPLGCSARGPSTVRVSDHSRGSRHEAGPAAEDRKRASRRTHGHAHLRELHRWAPAPRVRRHLPGPHLRPGHAPHGVQLRRLATQRVHARPPRRTRTATEMALAGLIVAISPLPPPRGRARGACHRRDAQAGARGLRLACAAVPWWSWKSAIVSAARPFEPDALPAVSPPASIARIPNEPRKSLPHAAGAKGSFAGCSTKRLMGLEPTTFCMALQRGAQHRPRTVESERCGRRRPRHPGHAAVCCVSARTRWSGRPQAASARCVEAQHAIWWPPLSLRRRRARRLRRAGRPGSRAAARPARRLRRPRGPARSRHESSARPPAGRPGGCGRPPR
jgi:hypothetical protein